MVGKEEIMRYVFLLTVAISLFIIGVTTSMEISNTKVNEHSFISVYKEDAHLLFFLDQDSSFYDFYSLKDASSYLILRKTGHFLVYGFIASIIFLTLQINNLWLKGLVALGSASFIGLIDEVHQHFLINRSGRILDVYINTAGSLVSVLFLVVICTLLKWIRTTHTNKTH